MSENAIHGDLNAAREAARTTIARTREQVRAYIPALTRRLGIVYGLPLLAAFIVSTLGAILLSQFIPSSTASIIAFGINIAILVNGWRWAERRYRATSVFILYTRYSRARRDLERAIKQTKDTSADALDRQRADLQAETESFTAAMRDLGDQPYSKR